jgi:exo-beta-1,3-glucanase (GH17 family)
VDVNVYLGIYPEPDDNNTAYNRQRGEIQDVLTTYGTDHVSGLTVGNEFMLKWVRSPVLLRAKLMIFRIATSMPTRLRIQMELWVTLVRVITA